MMPSTLARLAQPPVDPGIGLGNRERKASDEPTAHIAQLREALDRHERWAREGEDVFVQRLSDYLRAHLPASAAEDYEFTSMARPSAAGLRRWLERAETAQKAEATPTAG